mmetsp:Transcript_50449/g.110334  ORF Transcript_50449/g.110334 Transcript_50449/m.110334 type:complete len:285 (-) Transcript_50449:382-1236(-)
MVRKNVSEFPESPSNPPEVQERLPPRLCALGVVDGVTRVDSEWTRRGSQDVLGAAGGGWKASCASAGKFVGIGRTGASTTGGGRLHQRTATNASASTATMPEVPSTTSARTGDVVVSASGDASACPAAVVVVVVTVAGGGDTGLSEDDGAGSVCVVVTGGPRVTPVSKSNKGSVVVVVVVDGSSVVVAVDCSNWPASQLTLTSTSPEVPCPRTTADSISVSRCPQTTVLSLVHPDMMLLTDPNGWCPSSWSSPSNRSSCATDTRLVTIVAVNRKVVSPVEAVAK